MAGRQIRKRNYPYHVSFHQQVFVNHKTPTPTHKNAPTHISPLILSPGNWQPPGGPTNALVISLHISKYKMYRNILFYSLTAGVYRTTLQANKLWAQGLMHNLNTINVEKA